jgi:hypothetical protein
MGREKQRASNHASAERARDDRRNRILSTRSLPGNYSVCAITRGGILSMAGRQASFGHASHHRPQWTWRKTGCESAIFSQN